MKMNKFVAQGLATFFFFSVLFIAGCTAVDMTLNVGDTADNEDYTSSSLEVNMEKKYQELRIKGLCYIKKDPQVEDVRRKIEQLYGQYFTDCIPVSIGLQFILAPQESEFTESLLAVSANSLDEFVRRFFWYQDNIEYALDFLEMLRYKPEIDRIVEEGDIEAFKSLLEQSNWDVCSEETILQIFKEL